MAAGVICLIAENIIDESIFLLLDSVPAVAVVCQ
jgi:hypothetical protein